MLGRAPGAHELKIDIAFCGVFHSDIPSGTPQMGRYAVSSRAGPEIVGRVSAVTAHVSGFKAGVLPEWDASTWRAAQAWACRY
ncbi:alcohol dehydrogenase catalytic domain-containing protein [Caballeronia zhejiangensis]|uniref:alcohol dehydrogenase catalytic domain-containing protein n=1 Tax=Caballeronia zhejiangensis TaxID=871203 RepID=UPI00054E89C9|nr:alcohol dehydrogenase catalytic domain-containing protein [Caballeronia sp. GACF5]